MKNRKMKQVSLAISMALLATNYANAVEFSTSDFVFDLYGYVQLNASYDFDENIANTTRAGNFNEIYVPVPNLPNQISPPKGHFGADVRQTRLGFSIEHANGVLAVIEGEFRPEATKNYRLRHAYGQYEGFLAGQTWSNFTTFVGLPLTLDFDTIAGLAGNGDRPAQVRYTQGPLSFSIEENLNPTGIAIIGENFNSETSRVGITQKNSYPVLTAKIEDTFEEIFSYSAAAMVQELGFDGIQVAGQPQTVQSASTLGYGLLAAANININDMFTFYFNATYSNGINNNIYQSEGVAAVKLNNKIDLLTGYSGALGLSINNMLPGQINMVYAMNSIDFNNARTAEAIAAGIDVSTLDKQRINAFLNYIWFPVDNLMLGVEYGYFRVKQVNDQTGDASRLMFSAAFNF